MVHPKAYDVCGNIEPVKEAISQNKMNNEKLRIESYAYWSRPYIDIRELARNGFYFVGYSDAVCCFSCNLGLNKFEAGDDIVIEHKKYAPECNFLNGIETNNVPFKQTATGAVPENYSDIDKSLVEVMKLLRRMANKAIKPDDEASLALKQFDDWYKYHLSVSIRRRPACLDGPRPACLDG